MATERHGIELGLSENVTDALKSAGKAAMGARTALGRMGEKAQAAFSAAGNAVTVFNQGLEIGKKAFEVFDRVIGESIRKSLEFRMVGDETLKWFQDMGREAELVRARLGDALLPVIKGVGQAILGVTGNLSDYIAQNQKLIGSKVLEWFAGLADMVITVAKAVSFLREIWNGLAGAIEAVKVVANEFIRGLTMSISGPLRGIQKMAELFGAEGLAGKVGVAAREVEEIGAVFGSTAQDSVNAIEEISAEIEDSRKALAKMESTVKDVLEKAVVGAQKEIAKATIGTTKTIDEQREAIEKLKAAQEEAAKAAVEAAQKEQKARDEAAKQAQRDAERAEPSQAAQLGDVALEAAGSAGNIAQGFMQGGIFGGILAVIGEVIAESEALQFMLEKGQQTFKRIVDAFDPVFDAVAPLTEAVDSVIGAFMKMLKPVLESLAAMIHPIVSTLEPLLLLFLQMEPGLRGLTASLQVVTKTQEMSAAVLRELAKVVLKIFETLADFWNAIITAIGDILKRIGRIEILGKKPLGALERWGNDLIDAATVNTQTFDDARKNLEDGWESERQARLDATNAADGLNDKMKELNDSMTNVPAGLRVALNRFGAMTPEGAGMPGMTLPGLGAGAGGMTVNNMTVVTRDDPEKFIEQVKKEADRTATEARGALANIDSPSGPTMGSQQRTALGLMAYFAGIGAGG